MEDVAKRYQDNLPKIKKRIQNAHDYFKENYDRYNEFRRFVFESSLNDDEIALLMSMNRPQLEFNVLEAYISRLLGEFSKQEPDIEVNAFDENHADPAVIKVIGQHLKHVFSDPRNENLRYEVYKDLLSGGFSCVKVITDYEHAMSMNQSIRFMRCEPTLTGFDTLARLPSKGDGRFCFELFPKSKEEFEEEYPEIDIRSLSYKRGLAGFNWSYTNDNTKTVMVADYYEKKFKEETIVQVVDGPVMTMKKYRELVDTWNDITVPPGIVGKPRRTRLERIVRYRIVEDQVISYEETDFEMLPIVFVDGHSLMIASNANGNIKQVTRPYVYHAKGAQRLKNYAGISLANEIENTVQHKFMVAKEAIPKEPEFEAAYKDVQNASTLVFNSVYEKNPAMPIMNPIREIQRVPAPPEIANAFAGTDSVIQNVLGSYDASLGINNNQLSGVAIVEAASQSNATAMPYIVGCLQGMQRLAEIYVNLLPKYMVTPGTLPIIDEDGRRQFIRINGEEGMPMDFDTHGLNVTLTAGASFQVQKNRTINMVKDIMSVSPLFSQFIAEKGLGFILDNMEGKGIEELKDLTAQWVEQYQQEKQAAQQAEQEAMQQQGNPAAMRAEIDRLKLQLEAEKNQKDFEVDVAKLELEKEKMLLNAELTNKSFEIQVAKVLVDKNTKDGETMMRHVDISHRNQHDRNKLNHEIFKHLTDTTRISQL